MHRPIRVQIPVYGSDGVYYIETRSTVIVPAPDKLCCAVDVTKLHLFSQVRQFQSEHHLIRFYFLTRCYGEYFQSVLMDLIEGPEPDLIIMNSTLWDVTRYVAG